MSTIIRLFTVVGVLAWAVPAPAGETEAMDEATRAAVDQAIETLRAKNLEDVDTIAVMPLWDDPDGYVTETLKVAATNTAFRLVARGEAEWDQLLEEIGWTEKREDVMDSATVQRFGKILGCDAILYGTVRELQLDELGVQAVCRLTLHLGIVETGQIAWSDQPVARVPLRAETLLVRLLDNPAFLPAVICVAVVLFVGIILLVALRRRLALAMKQRSVT